MAKTIEIKPATGKLGVLIPGMGAVATTFVAKQCMHQETS